MSGFTKLFSSITESSVWCESKDVKILWVTMLAKTNRNGTVEASLPGLAKAAGLTLEEAEAAMETLTAPDPYSKNPDNDGRRVMRVNGGFAILNYALYRERRDEDERRLYKTQKQREYRSGTESVDRRVDNVDKCGPQWTEVDRSRPPWTQAEAETEAEADKDVGSKQAAGAASTSKKQPVADAEFVSELQALPAYSDINVELELQKMQSWCQVNHKHPTRRRFINWLNRVEKPMQVQPVATAATPKPASVWTLKQQLEALDAHKKDIEATYGIETPHGLQWQLGIFDEVKEDYKVTRAKIKEVRALIAKGGAT